MTLKEKVKKLESELDEAKRKAANLILNTEDNVFTKDELKKIKLLEAQLPLEQKRLEEALDDSMKKQKTA